MATIVDSYSESNQSLNRPLYNGSTIKYGQSFTGDGGTLNSVKFYLYKTGSPTGNVIAAIYAHSGTFGTNSVPTGSALATSDNFDVSTLTASYQLISFTFSGANKITLTNGTYYVVVVEYGGGDSSNRLQVGYDTSSPTHSGNESFYVSSWNYLVDGDACFYVYKDLVGPFPTHFNP